MIYNNKQSRSTINHRVHRGRRIIYYLFLSLLFAIPLIFWRNFDNGFDLPKAAALKVLGGIFIITCSSWLLFSRKNHRPALKLHKMDLLVSLFFLSAVLSAIFSVNPYVSFYGQYARQLSLETYTIIFLIYMFSSVVLNEENKLRTVILCMELTGVILSIYVLMQVLKLDPFDVLPPGVNRPAGTFGHGIFYAGFLTLIFPFSALNVPEKKSKVLKLLFPAVILISIIVSQTRTVYVALMAQVICMLSIYPFLFANDALKKRRLFKFSIAALVMIFAGITAAVFLLPGNILVERFLSIPTITTSPRWILWRDSFEMFKHFPLTGTGIAVFPNAFENFASYQLKFMDPYSLFDNAHNNFIQILCTMGILGAASYILILAYAIKKLLTPLCFVYPARRSRIGGEGQGSGNSYTPLSFGEGQGVRFNFAFFIAILGYIIYGLADFDDLSIQFYFFVLLAVFKNKDYAAAASRRDKPLLCRIPYLIRFVSLAAIILFSAYNIYDAYNSVLAEKYFSEGRDKYAAGDFVGSVNSMNKAIISNPNLSYYRFALAYEAYVYGSGYNDASPENLKSLLEQAKNEIFKAMPNHHSRAECLALVSLIDLELGNVEEANKFKEELFKIDTLQLSYRNNLTRLYIKNGRIAEATAELKIIFRINENNVDGYITGALYWLKQGNEKMAAKCCKKILGIDPYNKFAENLLKEIGKD